MAPIADTFSWTTVAIAVGAAALVALAGVLLVSFVFRRSSRRNALRLESVMATSTTRVEDLLEGLAASLAPEDTPDISGWLVEIASAIELDDVISRALAAVRDIPGVDAALIRADDPRAPIRASVGLAADELPVEHDQATPGDGAVRAAVSSYVYPAGREPANPVRGSVWVPVRDGDGVVVGALWGYWRTPQGPSSDPLPTLEEIARRTGPALVNARRYRDARELADLDPLTSLHNYRYFHEVLGREVGRAKRYDRALALILFDIDDFKAINDRVGHLAGDAVLSDTAACVLGAVRSADVACRVGGDELAVILPESGRRDAVALYERIDDRLAGMRGADGRLRLSAGIAVLRSSDDASALFKRADRALYRAKNLGKGQALTDESDDEE